MTQNNDYRRPNIYDIQTGTLLYAADSESSDSYIVNLSPPMSILKTGSVIHFKANTANTGSCSLNVNSLGAKTIKKNGGDDLVNNDIKANQIISVVYDGTNWQMLSPVSNTSNSSITYNSQYYPLNNAQYLDLTANNLYKSPITYVHTQGSGATTWTITHNRNSTNFNIDIFDGDTGNKIFPSEIDITDVNTITVTFTNSTSGKATITFLDRKGITTNYQYRSSCIVDNYIYVVANRLVDSTPVGIILKINTHENNIESLLDLNTSIKKIAFTSGGTYEIVIGDIITGATSNATATIIGVCTTGGTWAGGDASGDLYIQNQSGTFQSENLNVGANLNVATIADNSVNSALNGFDGCMSDNKYLYLVPCNGTGGDFGKVVRIDLQDFSTCRLKDLVLEHSNLKGFNGGFIHDHYAYFVPYAGTLNYIAKLDLSDFDTTTYLDVSSNGNIRYQDGFTDGTYGYICPLIDNDTGNPSGKFLRFDLATFSSISTINLASTDADLVGFRGGFTDNNYAYLIPSSHDKIPRIKLSDFSTVSLVDLGSLDANFTGFMGGCTDLKYGYLIPLSNYDLVRIDLNNFTTSGVESMDLTSVTSGSPTTKYYRGCTDGKMLYMNSASCDRILKIYLNNGRGY